MSDLKERRLKSIDYQIQELERFSQMNQGNRYTSYNHPTQYISKSIAYGLNPECLFLKLKSDNADIFINRHREDLIDFYETGDYTIILIEIFLENKDWKKDFLLGNYSKIYSEKDLRKTNIKDFKFTGQYEYMNKRYQVLIKDTEGFWDEYIKYMNEVFNGGIYFPPDDRELDLPPNFKEEILNYK